MLSRHTGKSKSARRRGKSRASSCLTAVPVKLVGASCLSGAPSSYATLPRISGQIKSNEKKQDPSHVWFSCAHWTEKAPASEGGRYEGGVTRRWWVRVAAKFRGGLTSWLGTRGRGSLAICLLEPARPWEIRRTSNHCSDRRTSERGIGRRRSASPNYEELAATVASKQNANCIRAGGGDSR